MHAENKNILFIYHRLDILGGIETRWIDEFRYLKKNAFKVHLAVPKINVISHVAEAVNPDNLILIESNKTRTAADFLSLVHEMINIIKTHSIDIISTHMQDLFSLASIIAAQHCKIPTISTIHGVIDIYRKPIERLLVQNLASKSYSLSIAVSDTFLGLNQHNTGSYCLIPNLVDFHKFQNIHPSTDNNKWLLINRISEEKYPSILRFIEAAHLCEIPAIDIAGGGNPAELKKKIKLLGLDIKVNFLGEVKNINFLIPEYYGIAGMGRAAIEGLACKKPVCIIALDGRLLGLANKNNIDTLAKFNFTGKGLVPLDNEAFLEQMKSYSKSDSDLIYDKLLDTIDVENWNKYIKRYNDLNFQENKALEALYHKISYFSNTFNKPFIEDRFFQHLFYETLIEYKMNDIKELWDYYEDSIGLSFEYPMPFSTNKKKRKSVLNKKKILFW